MRVYAQLIMICLYPLGALADGMTFSPVGAQMEVRATEQRAVMWLRDGAWEIHIQPIFEREAGRSAWVVPFPVRPEVNPGSIDFFDQLELLTSPVFVQVCPEGGGGGFGCLLGSGDVGAGRGTPSGAGYVKVWERGTVGELDYAVISSGQGESLVAWLEAEGFEVSNTARQALWEFETQGIFFFAARLSAEADPDAPLNPVRFVVPDMDPPAYPLKLTRLGVTGEDRLELTLWVVTPNGDYLPDAHAHEEITQELVDRESYQEHLELLYSRSNPDANLVHLYRNQLSEEARLEHQACSWSFCVSFEEMSIQAPEAWCSQIEEIRAARAWVSRFQGRMTSYSMQDDLSLSRTADWVYPILNIHEHWTCEGRLAASGCLVLLLLGLAFRRTS